MLVLGCPSVQLHKTYSEKSKSPGRAPVPGAHEAHLRELSKNRLVFPLLPTLLFRALEL